MLTRSKRKIPDSIVSQPKLPIKKTRRVSPPSPVHRKLSPIPVHRKRSPSPVHRKRKRSPIPIHRKRSPSPVHRKRSPAKLADSVPPSPVHRKRSPALLADSVPPSPVNRKRSPALLADSVPPSPVKTKRSPAKLADSVPPSHMNKASPKGGITGVMNHFHKLSSDPNSMLEFIKHIENKQDRIHVFNSNFKVRRDIKEIIEQYYNKAIMEKAISSFLLMNNVTMTISHINNFWPTEYFKVLFGPNTANFTNGEYIYVAIIEKIFMARTPREENVDHLLFVAFPELRDTGVDNFLRIKKYKNYEPRGDNSKYLNILFKKIGLLEIHGRLSNIFNENEMEMFEHMLLDSGLISLRTRHIISAILAKEIIKNFNNYYTRLSPRERFILIKQYILAM